jgi:hypothetical protein
MQRLAATFSVLCALAHALPAQGLALDKSGGGVGGAVQFHLQGPP